MKLHMYLCSPLRSLYLYSISGFREEGKGFALTHYIVDTFARSIVMFMVAQNSAGVW